MFSRSTIVPLTLLAFSFGCASSSAQPPPSDATGAASPAEAPGMDVQASSVAGPQAAATTTPATLEALSMVAAFDASKGGLPEGLAVRDGAAYVGFAPTGQILRMNLTDGTSSAYAALPTPTPNKGFMTGLDFDGEGRLYAALASFVAKPQAGIYRVSAGGKETTLFAKHDQMKFPNGIVLESGGNMFVTDSGAGAVFKVTASGATTAWSTSELLKGDKDFCGKGAGASFDIGANGIARIGNTVYVANNDRATIVRIPIEKDGSAGTASLLIGPNCEQLGGADGLAADTNGNLIVAANRLNRIQRVTPSGKLEPLADGGQLDFPASVALNGAELVATNFALFNAMSGKPGRPGLVKLRYGN